MSRSIRTFVIVATLCLASPHLDAQSPQPSHPDFTGTWRVDHVDANDQRSSGSDRPRGGGGFGRGGRRGGFGGGGGGYGGRRRNGGADNAGNGSDDARRLAQGFHEGDLLRIRQTEDHLILTADTDNASQMISYALDGKETKNKLSDAVTIKTKAKWDGVALVTDSEQSLATGRGSVTRKVHEILSLTDPDTLTVQSTSETPFGKRTLTATLKKAQN